MIQITPQMRILLAVAPVDFRNGIDGLAGLCRQVLATDPMAGALIVFCSRSRRALKLLVYDGQGYWLCQKRLSQGRFTGGPRTRRPARCVLIRINCSCCCGMAIPGAPKLHRCGGRLRTSPQI